MAQSDVVQILSDLLRIDTTNTAPGDAVGEAAACDYVAARLDEAGWSSARYAREDAPHRQNLVVRVPGSEAGLAPLAVQVHLDTVAAEADQWTSDPWSGEVRDGYVWGRGASDMKDLCASVLSVLCEWGASGRRPRRDIVVAFVADEETGGEYGAEWLVDAHPELFAGCIGVIGEGGGEFRRVERAHGPAVTLCHVAAAERGSLHCELTATGTSGHGSRPAPDSALMRLVDALHRLGHHRWPIFVGPVVRAQLEQTASALGIEIDLDTDEGVERAVDALGEAGMPTRWTIRASTTPTMIHAGYSVNVIPGRATAGIDVRCQPGFEDRIEATLRELIGPGVEVRMSRTPPVSAPLESEVMAAARAAVTRHDPDAVVVPLCTGGGTDAKAFARIGVPGYGFGPLTLDPHGRTAAGMHGVDERVPVASLVGGREVLADFLENV